MGDLDATYRLLDATGTLVLDLNSVGYAMVESSDDDETWERRVSSSPWVDGDAEDGARLVATTRSLVVRVYGDTWAQVEARRATLNSATSPRVWLLEEAISGVSQVWRAGRADRSSTMTKEDLINLRRFVTLRIPVQPTPAITGLGG